MLSEAEVGEILALARRGQSSRLIAETLNVSRTTVKKIIANGKWKAFSKPKRKSTLETHKTWILNEYAQCGRNAVVLHQIIKNALAINVSLRSVQRFVERERNVIRKNQHQTVRFECMPGDQLQIDFGQKTILLAGKNKKIKFFVATLSYSRLIFVKFFENETQSSWLSGIEEAFLHFGGSPCRLLIDNAKALVKAHNVRLGTVSFTDQFVKFCTHWSVKPEACRPRRPQTKGKVERSVRYVKQNALARFEFTSIEEVKNRFTEWMADVAGTRVHGTTHEVPIVRFKRHEKLALMPIGDRKPFLSKRSFERLVRSDGYISADTNHYSAPSIFIGRKILVEIVGQKVVLFFDDQQIASHARAQGKFQVISDPAHSIPTKNRPSVVPQTEAGVANSERKGPWLIHSSSWKV